VNTVLADVSFGELMVSILYIFFLVIFFWLLITIFADLFRRRMSGWAKAGWVIVIILLPFLGILVYLISRGHSWAEDHEKWAKEDMASARKQLGVNVGDELQKLSALHDQGKLTDAEFEAAKAKLI
jgi:Short C-terminal domain/Phospholipase_D-nuclease N-terminal